MPNPYPQFFHHRFRAVLRPGIRNSEIDSTIFDKFSFGFRTALPIYIIEQDMRKRIQPNFLGFRKSESIHLFSWGGSVLEKQTQ